MSDADWDPDSWGPEHWGPERWDPARRELADRDLASRDPANNDGMGTEMDANMDIAVAVTDPKQESPLSAAVAERARLIELCLYALDRARSAGIADRLESGLSDVGVTARRPDGERFDPSRHEAGGVVATDDPDLDGIVAETEVVGFDDRGTTLRVPVVTVYTHTSDKSG